MKHEWRGRTRTCITSDASKTELNRVPYALTRHCERIPKNTHLANKKEKNNNTFWQPLCVKY